MALPPGKFHKNGTEYQTTCPKCQKFKLWLSVLDHTGVCFYCQHTFGPRWYWKIMGGEGMDTLVDNSKNLTTFPTLVPASSDTDARKYLQGRGVDPDEVQAEIYYDASARRLFFPLSPVDGSQAPGYHTRGIDRDSGWIVYPGTEKSHFYYGTLLPRVILVEGIFDCFAVGYKNSVSVLGTNLSEAFLEKLTVSHVTEVAVWFDADAAGRTGTIKACKQLVEYGFKAMPLLHDAEPSECKCNMLRRMRLWAERGGKLLCTTSS